LGGESETDHQCEKAEYCTFECQNIFFTAGAHAKPASHLASNNNNNEAQQENRQKGIIIQIHTHEF